MGSKRLFLAAWVLAGFIYFIVAGAWVKLSTSDKAFNQYLVYVIDIAAVQRRPAKEVRSMLMAKAESMNIPLEEDEIRITHDGAALRATVEYQADLHIPIIDRSVYRVKFTHDVRSEGRGY